MTTQGPLHPLSPLRLTPSLKTNASPVAVVFVLVVTSQGCHGAQTDGIGKEDLGAGIDPHLEKSEDRKAEAC